MRRKVLIVDDDAATRRLYTAFLAKDVEILSCDTGVGAVEVVEKQAVDLVLMDLNMPGLDGWMAISLIRARRPDLPFLLITSGSDPELEGRARAAGASGFLKKPIHADALRQAVERAFKTTK
jgi:CheY-like chemotaxis protein